MTYKFCQDFLRSQQKMTYQGILKLINAKDHRGRTPVHIAVLNKNIEIILILINNGANLFFEDKRRNVRLMSLKV